ncbi:MAG: hypothetical protein ABEK50_12395 [bacterium]
MFVLRLILFLFVAGSMNIIAVLLAHTLPALHGFHREAVAVTAAFVLLADVFFLYLLFFRRSVLNRRSGYEEFDEILDETKTGSDADPEEIEQAYNRWKEDY